MNKTLGAKARGHEPPAPPSRTKAKDVYGSGHQCYSSSVNPVADDGGRLEFPEAQSKLTGRCTLSSVLVVRSEGRVWMLMVNGCAGGSSEASPSGVKDEAVNHAQAA